METIKYAPKILGLWGLILAGLLLNLMTNVPVSAEPPLFRYAYFTQQRSDKVDFHVVDPVTSRISDLFSLLVPSNHLVLGGKASPDGKFIGWLLYNKGTGQTLLEVVDSLTGQTRNIAEVQTLDEINTLLGPEPFFLWSPNSQYLAFNAVQANGLSAIEIYALRNGNLNTLTTDTNAYQFAWSSDSAKLAIAGGDCLASCSVSLDSFNIATRQHEFSGDLRALAREGAGNPRAALCYLNWSPDNLFLSFMMNCDSSYAYDQEIHVWDVAHNTDTQLTNFTTVAANAQPVSEIHANYKPFWDDAQTLLVGITLVETVPGIEGVKYTNQTKLYRWPGGQSSTLSSQTIGEWARNPISGELGLKIITADGQSTSIEIATLASQTLHVMVNTPGGCGLSWSPDGRILAYKIFGSYLDVGICPSSPPILEFITKSTGQIVRQQIPTSDLKSKVSDIGWILTGERLPNTATPMK